MHDPNKSPFFEIAYTIKGKSLYKTIFDKDIKGGALRVEIIKDRWDDWYVLVDSALSGTHVWKYGYLYRVKERINTDIGQVKWFYNDYIHIIDANNIGIKQIEKSS